MESSVSLIKINDQSSTSKINKFAGGSDGGNSISQQDVVTVSAAATNEAVNPETGKSSSFFGKLSGLAKTIYDGIFGSKVEEAKSAIKESKEIIKEVDKRLENDSLTESDRVVLEQVKIDAKNRISELRSAVRQAKTWSVIMSLTYEFRSLTGYASDEDKVDFTRRTEDSEDGIIGRSTPQELAASMEERASVSADLTAIILSISDANIRTSVLSEFHSHDLQMAKIIADKILPPSNATETDLNNAISFINNLNLISIAHFASDITQAVLDNIQKNSEMNEQADKLAYNNQLIKNKDLLVQQLKVAVRKAVEKLTLLKHYAEKLEAAPEDEKQKILAQILEQINKPKPIINS